MKLGVNLFETNKQLKEDFDGTILKLKEMGYSSAEPLVIFENEKAELSDSAEELIRKWNVDGSMWIAHMATEKIRHIREMGMEVPGIHAGTFPVALSPVAEQIKQFALENNLSYCVFSPQTRTLDEAEKFCEELKEAVKVFEDTGIELLLHNHDAEIKRENGRNALDYIMEQIPDIRLELDVGWVKAAGENVTEMIRSYAERIAILHYKDMTESKNEENGGYRFTALGDGILPLGDILKESKNLHLMDIGHIIDQDSSNADMMEDLKKGAARLHTGIRGEACCYEETGFNDDDNVFQSLF